jgi:hypothetical protein
MNIVIQKVQEQFWRRKMEKVLPPIIFEQGIGLQKFGVKLEDPEAESKFMNWMDARVKMARKPTKETLLSVYAFPLAPIDPFENGKEWNQMDTMSVVFSWEEYPRKREEIRQLFHQSRDLGAKAIGAVLINTGDALVEWVRQNKQST